MPRLHDPLRAVRFVPPRGQQRPRSSHTEGFNQLKPQRHGDPHPAPPPSLSVLQAPVLKFGGEGWLLVSWVWLQAFL